MYSGKESSIERKKVLSGKGTATKGEESLIRKRERFLALPRETKKIKKPKVLTPCQILGHRFCLFGFLVLPRKNKKNKKKKVLTPCQILGHGFCLFVYFVFFFGFSRFWTGTWVLSLCFFGFLFFRGF